jgi:hypothetical protein
LKNFVRIVPALEDTVLNVGNVLMPEDGNITGEENHIGEKNIL